MMSTGIEHRDWASRGRQLEVGDWIAAVMACVVVVGMGLAIAAILLCTTY